MMGFGVLFIWLNYHQPPNTEVVINLPGDQILSPANDPKTEQLGHFTSKILGISFEYPYWWGNLEEKIDPPHMKRNYPNWTLSNSHESQLFFQTISSSTTAFVWEGPEVFKYTTEPMAQLCKTRGFINVDYLDQLRVDCELLKNKTGIEHLKYKITYYAYDQDNEVYGLLFKTNSNDFPLLAVTYIKDYSLSEKINSEKADYLLNIISDSYSINL